MNQNKDFQELKIEQEQKARGDLRDNGLEHLITFTLENFAHRYLETSTTKNIASTFNGIGKYTVSSIEEDPISALKVNDPKARKGVIGLAKKFSTTKGQGLKIRYDLSCDISEVSHNGSGSIICRATVNWNMEDNFLSATDKESVKIVSFEFTDPLVLRNKLALLLEDVCDIF